MKVNLKKMVPAKWRKDLARVSVIRLQGTIGASTPLKPGLSLSAVNPALEKAFGLSGAKAVAISINSPGGSAVQSAQIYERIRQLSADNDLPVYTFTEDVAASGGYWLALAGDEIYADASSIVGSIGVLSAGFGFVEAIKKLGIERRVHTSGENKVILDPFQPSKKKDVDRLKAIQADIHESFKEIVRERRGAKLDEGDKDLFSGAFWTGRKAMGLGLIDGLGSLHGILREKYGDDVELKHISTSKRGLLGKFMPGAGNARIDLSELKDGWPEDLISAFEARSLWSRFGL